MNLLLLLLLVPCLPDDQVDCLQLNANVLLISFCSCYFTLTPSIHQDVFSSSAELASLARLGIFLLGSS